MKIRQQFPGNSPGSLRRRCPGAAVADDFPSDAPDSPGRPWRIRESAASPRSARRGIHHFPIPIRRLPSARQILASSPSTDSSRAAFSSGASLRKRLKSPVFVSRVKQRQAPDDHEIHALPGRRREKPAQDPADLLRFSRGSAQRHNAPIISFRTSAGRFRQSCRRRSRRGPTMTGSAQRPARRLTAASSTPQSCRRAGTISSLDSRFSRCASCSRPVKGSRCVELP